MLLSSRQPVTRDSGAQLQTGINTHRSGRRTVLASTAGQAERRLVAPLLGVHEGPLLDPALRPLADG